MENRWGEENEAKEEYDLVLVNKYWGGMKVISIN